MSRVTTCVLWLWLVGVSDGGVTFGFEDPGSGIEFVHIGGSLGSPEGEVSFRSDIPVLFEVSRAGSSSGRHTLAQFDAFFDVEWSVGSLFTEPGALARSAIVRGTFSLRDVASGEMVLGGSFDAGVMTIDGEVGWVDVSSFDGGGGLVYEFGEVLTAAGVPDGALVEPWEARWEFSGFLAAGGDEPTTVEIDGERYFSTFVSQGAFAGATAIPGVGGLFVGFAFGGWSVGRRSR